MPLLGFSQYEEEYDYSKEVTWGITTNTNSGVIGGLVLKFSKKMQDRVYRTIGFEIVNVKHPKEAKYTSRQTGTSFIFGKQNYLYALRGHYGFERLMFKKAPQQGVRINLGAAVGPTIGIVAPYYILTPNGEREQFDPQKHNTINAVQGKGHLFQGLGDSDLVPGINSRVSMSFEFGTFRNNVAGVELGVAAEAYTKKIVIVPTQDNRALFGSVFFTLFWGTGK